MSIEQRVEPIARVGCYVPGGRFPLPSSLLMTAVPARVAGVREIVAVCPRPEPVVMAAALEAGVTRLFRVGGAHAIAALAYGTATIPRVDKIVGPGNNYVAAAKSLVAGDCAIDFYAGPTEIVIVAAGGRPAWIAADMVAQGEHDPDARAILITWSRRVCRARRPRPWRRRRRPRDRAAIARRTRRDHRAALRGRGDRARQPHRSGASRRRPRVAREAAAAAGAVFVGPYTAQAAGDYATGSNHVLPTSGAARFRGGLSAADFVRVMSVQRVTKDGPGAAGADDRAARARRRADAHAESIEVRLK